MIACLRQHHSNALCPPPQRPAMHQHRTCCTSLNNAESLSMAADKLCSGSRATQGPSCGLQRPCWVCSSTRVQHKCTPASAPCPAAKQPRYAMLPGPQGPSPSGLAGSGCKLASKQCISAPPLAPGQLKPPCHWPGSSAGTHHRRPLCLCQAGLLKAETLAAEQDAQQAAQQLGNEQVWQTASFMTPVIHYNPGLIMSERICMPSGSCHLGQGWLRIQRLGGQKYTISLDTPSPSAGKV